MLIPALPQGIHDLLGRNTHPGLQIDKYARSWDDQHGYPGKLSEHVQRPAVEEVVKRSTQAPAGLDFQGLAKRRDEMLRVLGAESFCCVSTGPLTLHLARASALENAGICLHPIYGFAYLPGSGLKGMARAYAETVWLPAQYQRNKDGGFLNEEEKQKAQKAWRLIEDIFGWAPNKDRSCQIEDERHPAERRYEQEGDRESPEIIACTGSVVFHDAWPLQWPRLFVDITNCHHRKYYDGTDDADAPGDWEDPIPVYFLAVKPGTQFSFAVSKRRPDVDPALVKRAREWLLGALCHLGAGAKTAAGYGAFEPVEGTAPKLDSSTRRTFEATLELVTPAFLAGASQQREDCDLRPATLRGLLRWWWRTMHAAHVDVKTLRAMEAAIWGDTTQGGAVRITVSRDSGSPFQAIEVPFKTQVTGRDGGPKLVLDQQFAKNHGIRPAQGFVTQPLFYLSYGMDEIVKEEDGRKRRRRRYCVLHGARWVVHLAVRGSTYEVLNNLGQVICSKPISADEVLSQAKAALRLLTCYGGVGSKSRKGFGSLEVISSSGDAPPPVERTPEDCKEVAKKFRKACGLREQSQRDPESPALDSMLGPIQLNTMSCDPWLALDRFGSAVQQFAQAEESTGHGKHCESKIALGLPRQVHGPRDEPLAHQNRSTHRRPKPLTCCKGTRHSSPVHCHFSKDANGALVARVVAFPARYLPSTTESRKFLEEYLEYLKKAPIVPVPKSGDTVDAVLLAEKTKAGGWRAKSVDGVLEGHIINNDDVPARTNPGDKVRLIVASPNRMNSSFRWPTARDDKPAKKPAPQERPGSPGGRHAGGFRGGGPPRRH